MPAKAADVIAEVSEILFGEGNEPTTNIHAGEVAQRLLAKVGDGRRRDARSSTRWWAATWLIKTVVVKWWRLCHC